ncbi:MAG: sugar transferase, partial [Acidimicrobiales bacterium]
TTRLRSLLRSEPELGYVVTGVVDTSNRDPIWHDVPSSSSLADIPRLATVTGARGVMIVPNALSATDTHRAIAVAATAKLHVQIWPGLAGVGSRRLRLVPLAGEAFFYVEPRSSRGWELAAKRAIDVIGSAAACLVATPVLVVAAGLIKLDSHGPVLYRAQRIGKDGKPFVTFKLRTMLDGAGLGLLDLAGMNERVDGPLFKSTFDPRVTKVGRWLRLASIDELPQLWNVLMGTMSLVGPRPALPGEVAQFDQELLRRHCVRPGITGLWQIEARRNPSFNAYRRLDLSYVDNWSLSLDLSILAATVPSVISHTIRELLGHRRG